MFLARNRHSLILALAVLALPLALAACNMPGRVTPTETGVSVLYTAAAETVQAQLTQVSMPPVTPNGQTPVPPSPPDSTSPPETPAPPAPTEPGVTAEPGATDAPSSTEAVACDRLRFVQDVTVPDDSNIAPGTTFVKTWRLENVGSCTWTSDYRMVFEDGDAMGAQVSLPITTGTVAPGERVDVSTTLVAPNTPGTYRANFKLSNAASQRFGSGADGSRPFWVQINVGVVASGIVYDFVQQAAEARWTSAVENVPGVPLAYEGADDDSNGAAKIKDGVMLETRAASGKVLLMFPRREDRGLVSGLFPAYTVQPGDRLKARLGFMLPDGTCGAGNVIFEVHYREGDAIRSITSAEKSCTGSLLPIDISLSELSGKSVQFIFVVKANGSPADDWAIWNSPRIEN